ncbi:MAG: hypothetical protein H7Z15_19950 [Rhizobacter sp.]|nr:hypothetical protein [Rhizobacter sp.]
MKPYSPRTSLVLSVLGAAILSACGGDPGSSSAPAPSAPAAQLSGTVAVGAPITGGTLRVIDANGTVVASGITVADDGSYSVPTLSGTAPYRIEACGYAGPNYQCIYSVTQGPGTANVTPLTTATVLLATNLSPGDVMSGSGSALTGNAVSAAQDRLRSSLSGVMSGNVATDFDFVSGSLSGGSRTGYDKLLDSIGVNTGVDGSPFVQITPRLGSGNLYLDQTTTAGSVTVDSGASNLSLTGLETLFRNMSAAVQNADACAHASTGMVSSMASAARMSDDEGGSLTGATQVGNGLCSMFAAEELFGSRLLSPTLGRCDFSGSDPVCRVSFVLQSPEGNVQPVGQGMGVTREGGVWKFLGDLSAVQIHASAKAQRDVTFQDGATTITYARAIAFDIPALTGLQCAQVTQRDAAQAVVTVAYYKNYGNGARRMSLWQQNTMSNQHSLDPLVGALRSGDDTWVTLPDGTEGDAVVRNFFRGGRTVTVSLFSDTSCTTAFLVSGQSVFEVEVEGVPPTTAQLPNLPWTDLTPTARQALFDLTLAANASGTYNAAWTFSHGSMAVGGATFCTDRARCGDGDTGRISQDRRFAPTATSAAITLNNGGTGVEANSYKMLALYGRMGDGLDLQSNAVACPSGGGVCQ